MSRLGRNPFERRSPKEAPADFDLPPRLIAKAKPLTTSEKMVRFLQVDLPAEGFILGLKAALLFRSVWD